MENHVRKETAETQLVTGTVSGQAHNWSPEQFLGKGRNCAGENPHVQMSDCADPSFHPHCRPMRCAIPRTLAQCRTLQLSSGMLHVAL